MTNKNNNNLIIGIIAVVAIFILLGSLGLGSMSYGMMGVNNYGFMFFNNIIMILFVILIIVGIVWLIKNMDNIQRRIK